jgi:hypothetical protein
MHACPALRVMVGLHVGANALACAFPGTTVLNPKDRLS